MAEITTREISQASVTVKDAPLLNSEIDNNFINLNVEVITATANLSAYVLSNPNLETYLTWDSSTDVYETNFAGETDIHRNMKRCLLLDNGTVNYYLDPGNSNFKANGDPSVLTGEDGQVMVEIPKFYTKKAKIGNKNFWHISSTLIPGYTLHPAFVKDGIEVNYRYIGAYNACVYDTSGSTYISGLNLDDASALLDTAADKLSSVAGIYPMVGATLPQFRLMASNRGAGWRQLDFWLVSAVQMLYLLEFRNFNSQANLGTGNTNGSYLATSAVQTDSPHTIAGASNALGNISTNIYTGVGISANPGTSFMSYRGIENFFGNCWNAVDGININNRVPYVSNTVPFVSDTVAGYTQLTDSLSDTNGYQTNLKDLNGAFLPSSIGGSSTTYITDYYYTASGWCVVFFGGLASAGALAGAFACDCSTASSDRRRTFGSRLAF